MDKLKITKQVLSFTSFNSATAYSPPRLFNCLRKCKNSTGQPGTKPCTRDGGTAVRHCQWAGAPNTPLLPGTRHSQWDLKHWGLAAQGTGLKPPWSLPSDSSWIHITWFSFVPSLWCTTTDGAPTAAGATAMGLVCLHSSQHALCGIGRELAGSYESRRERLKVDVDFIPLV